jgi:hypothetical protein
LGKTAPRLLLTVGLILATAGQCRADIGVIVLEPIGPLGFFTRSGHAATYLSNICPDGSPIRMRICHPGEHGGVVSKYTPFSEDTDYDWAIVPFEEYVHGFSSAQAAPIIATPLLRQAVERYDFDRVFAGALHPTADGRRPEGEWKATLATRFERSFYLFSVDTSPADDAAIVAAFNAAPNKSRFNFFYRNCSNQAKAIFDLVLPDAIGDRTDGLTMEAPKGLAKALVAHARADPNLHLRVRRYTQTPGTFARSRSALFPMENTYRSTAFAPYWIFGGFREVALGALVYHQVLSPFSLDTASADFATARAAALTEEQERLRRRQDAVEAALTSAIGRDRDWPRLAALCTMVSRRLEAITEEKRAEADGVRGSSAHWRELGREFDALTSTVDWLRLLPEELARRAASDGRGALWKPLLQYIEANGDFYVPDEERGPWVRLRLAHGGARATGLSPSQILAGDSGVAVVVLAAAIDYNLHQPAAGRDDVDAVDRLLALFRRASAAESRPSARLRAHDRDPIASE